MAAPPAPHDTESPERASRDLPPELVLDNAIPVPLPPYLPKESFLRLSLPARELVVGLILSPPEPPPGYRKDLFAARGYQSYLHYKIARILEHLEYDSD
jgi:hypothetical protein